MEENLITRFPQVQAKEDQSGKVKKISPEARVHTKGSAKPAGHTCTQTQEQRFLLENKS